MAFNVRISTKFENYFLLIFSILITMVAGKLENLIKCSS